MKKQNLDAAMTICKEIDRLEKLRNLLRYKNLVIAINDNWVCPYQEIKMRAGDDVLFGVASLEFIARCDAAVSAEINKLEADLEKL